MMNQSMIIWCVIAGVLLFAFVFRTFRLYIIRRSQDGHKPVHLFEMGKESEMFYIPGDKDDDYLEEM